MPVLRFASSTTESETLRGHVNEGAVVLGHSHGLSGERVTVHHRFSAFVGGALFLVWPSYGHAQDLSAAELACSDRNRDATARIEACTTLLDNAAFTDLSDYAVTHRNRAEAFRDAENANAAVDDLNIALDYDPYMYEGYILRGDVLLTLGEAYRAIADFSVAAGINPLSSEPYSKRGLALFAHREYESAMRDLDTALGYDSNNPEARRTLAWILATAPDPSLRDGQKAMALMEGTNSFSAPVQERLVLAAALAEFGDPEAAIEVYRGIGETGPGSVERFQKYLTAAGFYTGAQDGIFSPALDSALRACLDAGCRVGAPLTGS